jgi:hypothetical protein
MTNILQTSVSGDNAAPAPASAPGAVADDIDLPPRVLPPAALRALAEAEERRRVSDAQAAARPAEIGGRGGPDPVRFGDWEKGGICWDF